LSGVLQAVNVSFCRNNIVQNLACGTLLQISNAANTIIADNNIYSNSVASVGIYTTALGKFTVTNNRLSGGFSGTPLTFYAVDGNVAKGNTLNGAHLPDSTAGIFEDWLPACPTGTGGAMLNGTWSQGSVVHNTNPSNAVGQAAGWLRMTTGTTNVLGTGTGAFDWRPYGVTA
jgi:hypothetical protein